MYGNFSATIETKDKTLSSYPALGFEFIANLEYNIVGEDDWTPFVLELKDAGVEHVYFTGTCLPNYQAFRAAASVNGYEAIYTTDANFYENSCREANSDGVMNNTYVRMAFIPFEERNYAPGVNDYLDGNGNNLAATADKKSAAIFLDGRQGKVFLRTKLEVDLKCQTEERDIFKKPLLETIKYTYIPESMKMAK